MESHPILRRRHTDRFHPASLPSSLPRPTPIKNRPRSYSFHPSSTSSPSPSTSKLSSPSSYGSSLLESLDLSSGFWTLREFLLGKLEEAEAGVQALKAFVEEESECEDLYGGETTEFEAEDDEEDHQPADEWEVVSYAKRRQRQPSVPTMPPPRIAEHSSTSSSSSSSSGPSSSSSSISEAREEISALEQFIKTASGFLSDVRSELPSLSIPTSSSLVQFELSPDARLALNHFLEDHPLPSFPRLHLRARLGDSRKNAVNSANAILSRVSLEMSGLRDVLAQLTYLTENSSPGKLSSYIPSLPSLPSSPQPISLAAVRDYFSSESDRLSSALAALTTSPSAAKLRNFSAETSASIAHLREEASELTSLLSAQGSAALDEAIQMYQRALERGRQRLLSYEELPHAWRNNEHILGGYRYITIDRWGVLLRSAFEWHNETINIQSHFIGFLSLVYLLVYLLPASPVSHPADTAIAILFIGAGMKCLLCSTAWHLLSGCASGHWHRGAACVDYVGISGLIAASVMGIEYYGFYCDPFLASFYMTFSAVLGVAGMILPWKPWFNERKYKMWRVGFFLGLAVSAAMPISHMAWLYGAKETFWYLSPVLPSVVAYLIGLSFYANQFPECAAPGYWDNFLASHQLWHFAIVAAIWTHYRAMTIFAATVVAGRDLSCFRA